MSAQGTSFDFIANAARARFYTTGGETSLATHCTRDGAWCEIGTAQLEDGTRQRRLYLHPQKQREVGKLAACYANLLVPPWANLIATVGFNEGATATDGVSFNLTLSDGGSWHTLVSLRKRYTGRLSSMQASLARWAGRRVTICLESTVGGPGSGFGQDWAAWTQARIIENYRPPVLDPADNANGGACGDPAVTKVGSTYYLVCSAASSNTNPRTSNFIPIYSSTNLTSWMFRGYALPEKPRWAAGPLDCSRGVCPSGWGPGCPCYDQSYGWGYSTSVAAPHLQKVGSRWVLYYSARIPGGKHALARATAAHPFGPYNDLGPLIRPPKGDAQKGYIDPFLFIDGSKRYLLYKHDLNDQPNPAMAKIYGRRLDASGTRWYDQSGATLLLTARGGSSWESEVIEGPEMVKRGSEYHLYFAGAFAERYSVGYAYAKTPLSRFTYGSRILERFDPWTWVGHGSIVPSPSNNGFVFLFQGYDTSQPRPDCWHRKVLAGNVVFDRKDRPTWIKWADSGAWNAGGCGW